MQKPSRLQTKVECFKTGSTLDLQIHHCIPGTHQRKKADEDGLWVYLNANIHNYIHRTAEGKELLHDLQKLAQTEYEKDHTREQFIKRYGKSYL